MKFNIIVAHCKNNGIGLNNNLPWSIKNDMKKFKDLTVGNKNNCVIMGRNTWESLNSSGLNNRDNLILSKTLDLDYINNNKNIIKSFKDYKLLNNFLDLKNYEIAWIIGGSEIYNYFLNNTNLINEIYVTYIDKNYICDTFFSQIDKNRYIFISKDKLGTINDENNETITIYNILYKSYFDNYSIS